MEHIGKLPDGQAAGEDHYASWTRASAPSQAVISAIHPCGSGIPMPKVLACVPVNRVLHHTYVAPAFAPVDRVLPHADVVLTEGSRPRGLEAAVGRRVML